jgi:hypothetical protein
MPENRNPIFNPWVATLAVLAATLNTTQAGNSSIPSWVGAAAGGLCCLVVVLLVAVVLLTRTRRKKPRSAPPMDEPFPPVQNYRPTPAILHPPESPSAAGSRLSVLRGSATPDSLNLTPEGITLGRGRSNTLVVNDPEASRQHARLDFVKQEWILTDLNSGNGTYVNKVRITQQVLHPCDEVRIGNTLLIFE